MKLRAPGVNTYGFIWSTPMADCVRSLHARGFDEFELVVNPPLLALDESSRAQRERLGQALHAEGIVLRSLNLPSLDTNLASPMARSRAYSVQMFRDAIDLAADLGIPHLVVVPGRMNPLLAPAAAQRQAWMRESLDALIPQAQARGVGLALENVPFASFPDAAALGAFVRGMGSPTLSVCYDVANAHFIGESPSVGLRSLGTLVSIVHLSDTSRSAWRHDEVGLGDVPFSGLVQVLDEIGFAGTCMLEIIDANPTEAIVRSRGKLAGLGFAAAPVGSEA
jgi:L-ribulose-5-phosphate 3-epimerase